jgi:hypothetical protein
MIRKLVVLGIVTAAMLPGQTASVSGVVKDKITGQPLANHIVSTFTNSTWVGNTIVQSSGTKQVQSTTDSSGRYKLEALPPGLYRISERDAVTFGSDHPRSVVLNGTDLENIDFLVLPEATISGKVLDENKEPVPGVDVRLIAREYYLGTPGYYFGRWNIRTNDLGEYTLTHVPAGRPYLLMVEQVDRNLPAHSQAPLDPKLRKRVPVRSWYPNSPSRESAQPLTLRPGEKREAVDIEMKKAASFCVEGTAAGPMGEGALHFSIEATQPSSGTSSSGGTYVAVPGGMTAADGKFRICGLYAGSYRLSAQDTNRDPQAAPNYGVTDVTITDQDLRGVRVTAGPGKPLEGEVAWELDPPATPPASKLAVTLSPLFRPGFAPERNGVRPDIPGTFRFDVIFPDEYTVRAFINAPGVYVKDVTFSGRSVLYDVLRPDSAMSGAGMRVVMAHDGGTISLQVIDKDGNPGADLRVLLLPADARSEGVLAARLVQGRTNQAGQYTSETLPPGKYYAVATEESVDPTPESMGRLWRARTRFQEVDLQPGGSAQVKLEPGKIE